MAAPGNITDPDSRFPETLVLLDDEVHIWRVDLAEVGGNEERWQSILSPDEVTRASRFQFTRDRQRFACTRALLRILLAGYQASDPLKLVFGYSKTEKPFLASLGSESPGVGSPTPGDLQFNVSHSAEVALLAFARSREIGVDVERIRHDIDVESIAERFFSQHERTRLAAIRGEDRYPAFFRCWTRKEAYIKANGAGLALPLRDFDVSIAPSDQRSLLATRPDASEACRWSLSEVPAGSGYTAAVCIWGTDLRLRSWSD